MLQIKDRARDRYHALSISSVWDLATIRGATALIVGAGALGNEVAKNLGMMGVAYIAVIDRDTVETANLTRSVLFREADHGRPKATVMAERLRELNPDIEVVALVGDLEALLGLGLLRRMDLVFSCLDSRLARRNLNRMCEKVGRPWVDGAMEDLFGDVAVYVPDGGACYECGLTRNDLEILAEARSCRGIALQNLAAGKFPTTSTMGSIIAALQVQEALKLLHGDSARSLAGKRLTVNCLVNDFFALKLARKPDCGGHIRFGEIQTCGEWTAAQTAPRNLLSRFLQDTGEPGCLDLGREVVTHLTCPECQQTFALPRLRQIVKEHEARCPQCGQMRVPETTHTVAEDSPYCDRPLEQLGVPNLDILQVVGPTQSLWYELSGDVPALLPRLAAQRAESAG